MFIYQNVTENCPVFFWKFQKKVFVNRSSGHGTMQINLEHEIEAMEIKYDGRQSKELEEKHHLQERGPEALL